MFENDPQKDVIDQVWSKGYIVPGYNANKYRKDITGAWMEYSKYGATDSDCNLGWEIDHCKPEAQGGSSKLFNLRPLHWRNNRSKGDDFPRWSSVIGSDGNKNIYKPQVWLES